MTELTRPATWDDVLTVVRLLEAHAVQYALIGGYALAAHGDKDRMDARVLRAAIEKLEPSDG